ncbi:MAG: arginase [Mesorhizobium sp.]|uniref:agmatinase n=1 Tax=unclassified Mesorhizobium TaxID=325217 RepID=UPI000F75CFF0|nr:MULTISPECIES: agmatinase [unclassified Mesorhizobium]AZO73339.1 arginase [Mesorhizobium sp. M1D.F.Ca.ET.043.01.1.1]RWA95803.1 MAG: arginase [Mesorhizobium sp.]TJW84030.1 MAG: arginase [Mesorhizobium sp.]
MSKLTTAPRDVFRTFMNFPLVDDLDALKADVAIIGMPYGDPYTIDELVNDQTNAPTAVRRASQRVSLGLDRYDFDIGGTLFDGQDIRVADVGDVPASVADPRGHYGLAEATIRKIRTAGALPIAIGGDHGIPIPILRALDGEGPVTLVQVDAHLDWRDNVNGVREGYSSPIRRASEMAHIDKIFQLGIRGQGSARGEEVEAARAYGSNIITANEWQDIGTAALLKRIPDRGRYYLTIDADGLDPAVMPAVEGPSPGGVSYRQTIELIKGLIAKGKLVGMDIVEIAPSRDVNEITAITAGNIILNVIGAAVRAGYFKR